MWNRFKTVYCNTRETRDSVRKYKNIFMGSGFSRVPSTGDVTRSPETECNLEWRVPNFVSLMAKDEIYFSPTFSFAEEIWRMFIAARVDYLHVGVVRESTIPAIRLDVSVCLKTLNGKKDRASCTRHVVPKNGHEMHLCNNYLQNTELLERKSDLLPSEVLTVLYTLKLQKATEDSGNTATSMCPFCKDIVDVENISFHEKKCVKIPIKCPKCSDVVLLKNWYAHECQTSGAEDDIATSKCPFCKDTVDVNYISSHENKCVNKPIKCEKCSDVVVLKNWYEHECQIARAEGEPCTSTSSNVFHENKLQHDFKDMFFKKENCDVVIKVQGQEFHAHKIILEARSPVLAATFRNNMKEKASGVVDIEDCDPSSFSEFLCFLYCGDMEIISQENVFNLFMAADKYDVQDLRAQCFRFMKDNISVDTFCDTIALALRHSETELINLTTEFFLKNAPKIIVTVKWQIFLDENPTQSNELLIKLLINNQNSNS